MNKDNKTVSPYANEPATQGYIDALNTDIETLESAKKTPNIGRKAVETLNRLISWMTQYRRGMEHSLTHWAATERANTETGLGTDLDTIVGFATQLREATV